MSLIRLRLDVEESELGFLHPTDVELSIAIIQLINAIYIVGFNSKGEAAYRSHPAIGFSLGGELPLLDERYTDPGAIVIKRIRYESPMEIWAFFKHLPKGSIDILLNRTLFFSSEQQRRGLENERLAQEVVSKKLANLGKVRKLAQDLVELGVKPEDARDQLVAVITGERLTVEEIDEQGNLLPRRPRLR